MEKQISFTDLEYGKRRKVTKREVFLTKMDAVLPWKEWVELVRPFFPDGKRGRPPQEIEVMLRMLMLQVWFQLSDEGVEDAIYDSYAMKSFLGLKFATGAKAPDATADKAPDAAAKPANSAAVPADKGSAQAGTPVAPAAGELKKLQRNAPKSPEIDE